MGLIKLSDAIENLRSELKYAREKGKNQDLQFDLQSIEIELEVIAEDELSTSGKVNWYIFGGGIDSREKNASKHKLKLTLKVVDEHGQPLRVAKSQTQRPT